MMNKRGSLLDLFLLIAGAMVIIIFFAVMIFGVDIINTQLSTIQQPADVTLFNLTDATARTFGEINDAFGQLRVIAFIMILAMALSIFISNIFIRSQPFFFGIYILVVMITVVFSVEVSNAYEGLLTGNILSPTLVEFTGANFIMLNLPFFMTVIGIFGAIFLFMNLPRGGGLGGSIGPGFQGVQV